ncbi:UNVERIFIED_CONTAM: hypothetical protein Sangu_1020000 [Sesamum angustifolium]|uniref:Integrase catalytic domain-containing protein n=1 Tax=Sesamum angustifolium TaxID=2727405 RepID=A0AAW2NYD7_9LAMI
MGISLVDPKPTRKIMSKNPLTMILDNNKFNGTNYTDWLRNLRIVLDYENQGYIMDKPLSQTLWDGSSCEAHETFERWHANHRKVRSIMLASMSNDVQDDVASILQRIKEVYVIPDRHTRYIATKEFFRAKMTEGSSVQEHGVKMLSLVKLEDLKAGLENDTYIDWEWARERRGWVHSSSRGQTISAPIAVRKGIGRGIAPIYLPIKVLQRSRKLSKGEVVLRLGDGKVVIAEAVGIISLVFSDRVRLELKDCYFVPRMIKNIISIPLLDNAGFEFLINKNCFYLLKDGSFSFLGLGHISQDRMKRLVDSKSLEIDNLDNLPAYESYLKGKMTKKPFVGQSKFANSLLDLIHTDICGPLNTQAIDYLKENGIVSQWTPPGTPQLNGVAERRNRTLLDMIRSMMSFTELSLSFWGYALEMAARLLNIAPSKIVAQTPYQIWHGKPVSYKYLRVWDSPTYVKRLVGDKLDSRSSLCRFIGYPKETEGIIIMSPLSKRSARVPQSPERYAFLGVTGQLDNDPKTYREAISDIDSGKWLEAMKSKMDSISSKQVWTLVDRPKGVRPVGCK